MARHYLDHASTSPLRTVALDTIIDAARLANEGVLADPGRIHTEGMTARAALEDARAQVAAAIGARSREIVFTSGSTEAIATATWGAVRRAIDAGVVPHIVHSAVEHSAVRRSSAQFADAFGGSISVIGVDPNACVDVDAFIDALSPTTALAHIQWGNHEVGTLQPVAEIIAACREREVLVHVDATQAVGRVPVDFGALDADLLSFGGHEFGAPAGVGVLAIRRGLRLHPLLLGGEQERARRAGTEDLIGLLALGATLAELDRSVIEQESDRARTQLHRAASRLTAIDGIAVLGDPHPTNRLPHIACVAITGVEPQGVVLGLDQRGIAVHSGSSCASEGLEPSPVLEAMGVDAHRSLRISVGWNTTDDDIDALCDALPEVVGRLRALAE